MGEAGQPASAGLSLGRLSLQRGGRLEKQTSVLLHAGACGACSLREEGSEQASEPTLKKAFAENLLLSVFLRCSRAFGDIFCLSFLFLDLNNLRSCEGKRAGLQVSVLFSHVVLSPGLHVSKPLRCVPQIWKNAA